MRGAMDGSEAAELEPMGSNAGMTAPEPPAGHEQYPIEYEPPYPGFSNTQSTQYRVDGIDVPYDIAIRLLGSGAANQCPNNDCGPQFVNGRLSPLTTDPNTGRLGYGQWERVDQITRDQFNGEVIDVHQGKPYFRVDAWAATHSFIGFGFGGILPQETSEKNPCMSANAEFPESGIGFYTYEDPAWLRYAQPGVVNAMLSFAEGWIQRHPGFMLGIGDLGAKGGKGDFDRHPGKGHAGGVIVDMRPMTLGGSMEMFQFFPIPKFGEDKGKTYVNSPNYNASLTAQLASDLLATGLVERILFNDKNIIKGSGGKVRRADGHGDHLHVIFKSGIGCP
jgi:hypothetical protein